MTSELPEIKTSSPSEIINISRKNNLVICMSLMLSLLIPILSTNIALLGERSCHDKGPGGIYTIISYGGKEEQIGSLGHWASS